LVQSCCDGPANGSDRAAPQPQLDHTPRARRRTRSPLIRLSGQSPNQEEKWASVFHRLMSSPTSLKPLCATIALIPSIRIKSTPEIRASSWLRSNAGAFCVGLSFLLDFPFRRGGLNWIAVVGKSGKALLYLLVALGDPLLIAAIPIHFVLQYKHQFGTPIALQTFANLSRSSPPGFAATSWLSPSLSPE